MVLREMNLANIIKKGKVPGVSLSIIDEGRIILSEGYGVLESNSNEKVDLESLFHACSMSKFVTAMAVLRLVSLDILNLDEDVNDKLKIWKITSSNFKEDNKVTLRLLLSHQGGIIDVEGSFGVYDSLGGFPNLIDILDGRTGYHSKKVEVEYSPGSGFEYSDAGFCIIEQLLVDVMEKPFSQLMNELVITPLQMYNSLFTYPMDIETKYLLTSGHDQNGQIVEGKRAIYPYLAAAGLWTTPTDLAKLILDVVHGLEGNSKLGIRKELMEEMISPHGKFEYAGLGVFVTKTSEGTQITSQGWGIGFQCMLAAFPETGKGAVVMINSEPGKPQQESLVGEIAREISREYNWPTKVEFF